MSRMLKLDKKVLWLLKKEIKSVLRSRWLIVGFIISPLFAWMFQGAFLSFIVAQTTEEPETIFVTIEDQGPWGNNLLNAIEGNQSILLIEDIINIQYEEGQEMVANRTVSVWLYIPSNFSAQLEDPEVGFSNIILYVNTGNIRASAAAQRIDMFSHQYIDLIVREVGVSWQTITPEATYGHNLAIFLVILTSVLAPAPYVGKSFAGEREQHTLEALLVVPMSRLRILGAKLLAGLLLTMIYSAFTVVGILMYNTSIFLRTAGFPEDVASFYNNLYSIDVASLPLIFFCQFLILLTAIGIGVVISMLSKDQATAESMNNLVLLVPTMVIGILGFTGSILQYGGIFGILILAIPFSHAVIILNGVLSGLATPIELAGNVAYMLGFTILFLVIGARLFERENIIT